MRKKFIFVVVLLAFLLAGSSSHAEVLTSDKKVFDYVINYWKVISPDKDTASADRMEKNIQHWAIATYEGTRGAHTLGKVYILQGDSKKDTAHVLWSEVHPEGKGKTATASMGGYPYKTGHIKISEEIFDTTRYEDIKPGYSLAHEAGHFVYKLGDEYKYQGTNETNVDNSIMGRSFTDSNLNNPDAKILSFSTSYHLDNAKSGLTDPSTFTNHQYREYGQSCWETLMSSSDPAATSHPRFERVHFTDLSFNPTSEAAAFRPFINNDRLDWDNAPKKVKDNLEIIWFHGNAIMLLIDRSASMEGNTNKNAVSPLTVTKKAALAFVKALPDDCVLGVMDFDTNYRTVHALSVLPKDRSPIYDAINSITADDGLTAIYDAVYRACARLNIGFPNYSCTIVLITDGDDNSSSKNNTIDRIVKYSNGRIQMHIIGTGDCDEVLLSSFSKQMNGKFYDSSLGDMEKIVQSILGDIMNIRVSAETIISGRKAASLSLAPYDMESQETAQSFWVNSNSEKVAVTLSYQGKKSDISVALKDPDGQIINENIDHQDGKWTADIINPKMGQWNLDITYNTTRDIEIDFSVLTYPIKGHSGYTANIGFLDENALKDNPIVDAKKGVKLGLAVAVEGDPLTSVNLQSQITHPSGLVEYVNLEDEDESGFYSLFYDSFSTNGVYTVNVKASNEDGKGKLSFKSYMGDNGPGGISNWEENFETTGMFQFIVDGATPLYRVNSVWISDRSLIMEKGDRKRLSASVTPSNATNQKIDWFSSDNSVAVVDRNGEIEALKGGVAVITAITADGNHQAHSEITVFQEEKAGCHTGFGAIIMAIAFLALLNNLRRQPELGGNHKQ